MRIAFWGWTAVLVAADLAVFALLPAWERGWTLVSNAGVFVGITFGLVFVWFVGWGVGRELGKSFTEWRQVRRIRSAR